jgi:D-alanyl-D-alanine carboxypeptidase (penicillin-binding protein 5/6)
MRGGNVTDIKGKCCIMFFTLFIFVTIAFDSIRCHAFSITQNEIDNEVKMDVEARSAILMEFSTGKILYEKNAHERLMPASVTKVMTMLLAMEAIDSGKIKLSDKVSVSEHACTMGGTQIFLAPGEIRTVEELLMGVSIESGNDAAVALAEYIEGSEELFVQRMNERAKQLGMNDTHFSNVTGLPIENHFTSAMDISLMSKELLKHKKILDYTRIWMETISEGREKPFTMVNKNKLVKFYKGCDGLKTGYTTDAKYCISATAERSNMRLIAVTMASPTSKIRNREVSKLLDYGFARYEVIKLAAKDDVITNVRVLKGKDMEVKAVPKDNFDVLVEKGSKKEISKSININEIVRSEVKKGDKLGEIIALMDGVEVGRMDIVALKSIPRANIGDLIGRSFNSWLISGR